MLKHPLAKPAFFLFCLAPFMWIAGNLVFGDLGANPVETITHQTGDWTLRFLILTLLLTPLKTWTGLAQIIRFRRMAGLFVYFYACNHFLIWFLADHSLSLTSMLEDVVERPYITMGFSAFVLLTPLAITSNKILMKKLGRNWKRLHRLVYPISILAVVHYLWLVKADYLEPMIYAAIVALLLLVRLAIIKTVLIRFQSKITTA